MDPSSQCMFEAHNTDFRGLNGVDFSACHVCHTTLL